MQKRMKDMLGDLAFAIVALQDQNDKLLEEIRILKDQLKIQVEERDRNG